MSTVTGLVGDALRTKSLLWLTWTRSNQLRIGRQHLPAWSFSKSNNRSSSSREYSGGNGREGQHGERGTEPQDQSVLDEQLLRGGHFREWCGPAAGPAGQAEGPLAVERPRPARQSRGHRDTLRGRELRCLVWSQPRDRQQLHRGGYRCSRRRAIHSHQPGTWKGLRGP